VRTTTQKLHLCKTYPVFRLSYVTRSMSCRSCHLSLPTRHVDLLYKRKKQYTLILLLIVKYKTIFAVTFIFGKHSAFPLSLLSYHVTCQVTCHVRCYAACHVTCHVNVLLHVTLRATLHVTLRVPLHVTSRVTLHVMLIVTFHFVLCVISHAISLATRHLFLYPSSLGSAIQMKTTNFLPISCKICIIFAVISLKFSQYFAHTMSRVMLRVTLRIMFRVLSNAMLLVTCHVISLAFRHLLLPLGHLDLQYR
jgi:hypothetical protein